MRGPNRKHYEHCRSAMLPLVWCSCSGIKWWMCSTKEAVDSLNPFLAWMVQLSFCFSPPYRWSSVWSSVSSTLLWDPIGSMCDTSSNSRSSIAEQKHHQATHNTKKHAQNINKTSTDPTAKKWFLLGSCSHRVWNTDDFWCLESPSNFNRVLLATYVFLYFPRTYFRDIVLILTEFFIWCWKKLLFFLGASATILSAIPK